MELYLNCKLAERSMNSRDLPDMDNKERPKTTITGLAWLDLDWPKR